jgi:hypothetical protein
MCFTFTDITNLVFLGKEKGHSGVSAPICPFL